MLGRVQVRGRLLLAFFAIAGLAVLAAGAAIYSFLEVGGVLNRITGERVPSALASQELSRQAERIVAIAPALLAVGTTPQHDQISAEIAAEVARLDDLLADVERSSRDASVLETISLHVGMMERNLDALDALVADRLAAGARKDELLRRLSDADIATQRLLTPGTLAMEGEVRELQRIARAPGLSADQRTQAMSRLIESIAAVPGLQRARTQAAAANTALLLAASAESAAALVVLTVPLERSMNAIESAVVELGPNLGGRLEARAKEFRSLTSGEDSIPQVRQHELVTVEVIEILLEKNREFSGVLTAALDELVAGANRDIGEANREALSIQRFSTVIMAAVVALVVVSSLLIVWLYVGRNLIARLTKLTGSMMAIAQGQLDAPIPTGGSDEISRMADALTVFRDTAIEVRQTNLREIRAARTRLTDAIESISDGFVIFDQEGRLVLCNSKYRDIYPGVADIAIPGTPFETILRTSAERGLIKDAANRDEEWIAARLARHSNPFGAFDQEQTDGRWIQINERRTEDGGTVAVYSDVTERKNAENELLVAKTAAEDATKAKSVFLASMSHELRTPLNAIIGYSEMLMEDAEERGHQDTVPDLQRIHAAGDHLLTLIHDVLDLSKIEAGKAEIFVEEFEIADLIQDVRAIIEPLMAKNANRFDVEHDRDIGSMRSDTTKIRQNLFNLLSNAAKFTDHGEVRLGVTGVEYNGVAALRFVVSDTGIGVEPDKIETLFDEFTQADASTTKRYGGAGLGLVITRKFAEMLGGEVSANSVLGEGATFTMILPRKLESAPQPAGPRVATEAEAPYQGTVLVIDDDEHHHDTMADSLPKRGYRLLHALGGQEGLELARIHRPDLITLDIIMDGQDGWSVLSELKRDPALRDIPVIILTISRNHELAFSLGAADFVAKPFDAAALANLIGARSDGDGVSQILVVDDDPAARDMLRRWFAREDWNVKEVANGTEALAWLQRNVPHLIILDLLMPGIDGFEVLETVRAMTSLEDVPVVVSTVKELSSRESSRLRGKANNVLRKGGYDKDTLLRIVRDHLGHIRSAPAAATSNQAQ